jgi:hypothetical protein
MQKLRIDVFSGGKLKRCERLHGRWQVAAADVETKSSEKFQSAPSLKPEARRQASSDQQNHEPLRWSPGDSFCSGRPQAGRPIKHSIDQINTRPS